MAERDSVKQRFGSGAPTDRREPTGGALPASEATYRLLFEASHDAVVVTDVDTLQIVDANPAAAGLYGWTEEQLKGMPATELSTDPEATAGAIRRAARAPMLVRRRHRRRDHTEFDVEIAYGNVQVNGRRLAVAVIRDLTERARMEAKFRALVEHSSDLVLVLDENAILTYASPSVTRLLGYSPAAVIGRPASDFVHPDDLDAVRAEIARVLVAAGTYGEVSYRATRADGSYRNFEAVGQNRLDDPAVRGIVVNARDVTDRRAAEHKAAELTEILEASDELIVVSDPAGHIVYANQAARTLLRAAEHRHVSELSTSGSQERIRAEIMPIVHHRGAWSGELELIGPAGPVPVAVTIRAHHDDSGQIQRVATIAHDISTLKAAQTRLEYEASHDLLTGLPNRALFREIAERAIARTRRHRGTLAVLFLDLDGFKLVNDGFGHDTGDQLLAHIAHRLRETLRLGDTVARLGGDEFVVLCEHPESEHRMLELAERLIAVASEPFRVYNQQITVGASIGIAFSQDGASAIGELIREADIALYRAKHDGRGQATIFNPSLLQPDTPSVGLT
jgi:diguanylate cyclase (GGDEF)-like protein/PAS domain S-box-containing protein